MSNLGGDGGIEPGSNPFQNNKLTYVGSSTDSALGNYTVEYDDCGFDDITNLLYPDNDNSVSIPSNPCHSNDMDNERTPKDTTLLYPDTVVGNSQETGVGNSQFGQLQPLPSIELPDILISPNDSEPSSGDNGTIDSFDLYYPPEMVGEVPPPTRRLTREMRTAILEAYQWFPREMTVKAIAKEISDWLVIHYKLLLLY